MVRICLDSFSTIITLIIIIIIITKNLAIAIGIFSFNLHWESLDISSWLCCSLFRWWEFFSDPLFTSFMVANTFDLLDLVFAEEFIQSLQWTTKFVLRNSERLRSKLRELVQETHRFNNIVTQKCDVYNSLMLMWNNN